MKVGFLHVPKCAGTSLSTALYAAFGVKQRHISALRDPGTPFQRQSVERGSPAFSKLGKLRFLSGHVSFSQMKELNRDFIFTTLREPMERVFSLYTYALSRASNPEIVARRPELAADGQLTFTQYMARNKPNGISRLLFFDVPALKGLHRAPEKRAKRIGTDADLIQSIDAALSRFDMILAGSNDHLAKHLGPLTPAGEVRIERLNESRIEAPVRIGCSEDEFRAILRRYTWLDTFVCQRAAALFPELVDGASLSADAEAIQSALQRRYDLVFA